MKILIVETLRTVFAEVSKMEAEGDKLTFFNKRGNEITSIRFDRYGQYMPEREARLALLYLVEQIQNEGYGRIRAIEHFMIDENGQIIGTTESPEY